MIDYSEVIRDGIEFLYKEQNEDGSYPDNIFYLKENVWNRTHGNIFSTSVITHCITGLLNTVIPSGDDLSPKCKSMINRSVRLFTNQMKINGLWKFGLPDDDKWSGLPPDMDDTCCVSFLMKNIHPYIHLGINKKIIYNNRTAEGLFLTWIKPLPPGMMNSTDIVVNANVCLYLGENEYTEKVIDHICDLINNNKEAGSFYYYKDRLALYYMISRAYKEGIKGFVQCREKILNNIKSEYPQTFFYAALSAVIMLNFGYRNEEYFTKSLTIITGCRNENGGWNKYPFSAGGEYPEAAALYFGSECLSTAFCLEAVAGIQESLVLKGQSGV